MKVMTVLGTRPEIIKLSPLIPLLDKEFNHFVVHSGQHYSFEMDSIFFRELGLKNPKYNLKVGSGTHGFQTGRMLERIEHIIINEKPDIVLTLGDTNTTLAGALAATKLNIKVVHIEAGCRSFNRSMPEEINRIVVDHCSDYLFAPDKKSVENLLKEGIDEKRIYMTGSLIIDACLRSRRFIDKSEIEKKLKLKKGKYILVTIHRAENTESIMILKNIISALNEISEKINVVFVVHPRTMKLLRENKVTWRKNVIISKPLGYFDLLRLIQGSRFIITDSGGIQEEACVLNTPCLVARNETEWMRLVEGGKNFLVGNKKQRILKACNSLLDDKFLETVKKRELKLVKDVDKKILSILKNILRGN